MLHPQQEISSAHTAFCTARYFTTLHNKVYKLKLMMHAYSVSTSLVLSPFKNFGAKRVANKYTFTFFQLCLFRLQVAGYNASVLSVSTCHRKRPVSKAAPKTTRETHANVLQTVGFSWTCVA